MTIHDQLKRDEGVMLHVYLDSLGIKTAGVGHNLEAHGIDLPIGTAITQEQADEWLWSDVQRCKEQLEQTLPWAVDLDDARYGVLLNMCFNMGIGSLLGFHRTLAMIQAGNYDGAAEAMLESKWAQQVGKRAERLAEQMRTGIWQ